MAKDLCLVKIPLFFQCLKIGLEALVMVRFYLVLKVTSDYTKQQVWVLYMPTRMPEN